MNLGIKKSTSLSLSVILSEIHVLFSLEDGLCIGDFKILW